MNKYIIGMDINTSLDQKSRKLEHFLIVRKYDH